MDRVLAVKRYSGEDDAGALERQHAELLKWITNEGAAVAGWVEDETVSGSVNLDERKSLGQWLRLPLLDHWDVMVVTSQDRVTRDDIHWWAFVGKLLDWGKRLIVLDDLGLDLSTPNGRMIAGVKATQAANYRLDVKSKARRARAAHREQRRYAGGHWPYGHRAEPREGAEGWQLVADSQTSEMVQEAVNRIIRGDSLSAISRDWDQRGVLSARDHQSQTCVLKPGEERPAPKNYRWNESTLRRILTSPTLLGYASHYGELLREDGLPIQFAPALITVDEFTAVQEALSRRGGPQQGKRKDRSALAGIVYHSCGRMMNHATNRGYRYYRCGSIRQRNGEAKCEKRIVSWPDQLLKDHLEELFMDELGNEEIKTKTLIPGKNRDPEIQSLRDALDHLSGNLANLKPDSRAANNVLEKINEYEAQLDELEQESVVPSSWSYSGTGETYGEHWRASEDWFALGRWLLNMGIRMVVIGTPQQPHLHLIAPPELTERAHTAVIAGVPDVSVQAWADEQVKRFVANW